MNAEEVRRTVGEADSSFRECWDILAAVRATEPPPSFSQFQRKLGLALLDLEDLYNKIATERRDLISRKESVSLGWFEGRQRALARYQRALRRASGIGRAIGDAFAWFFYQFSTELLSEHLTRPSVTVFPAGESGLGEIGLVSAAQMLDGRMAIHHGLTTILRIGDVSFVDLKRLRIDALGEIKSKHLGDGRYHGHLALIGRSKPIEIPESKPRDGREPGDEERTPLPQWVADRLAKQVRLMEKAIEPSAGPTFKGPDQFRTGLTGSLSSVAQEARVGRPAMRVVDPCAMLIVVRYPRSTLYSRLAGGLSAVPGLDDVPRIAQELVLEGSQHNSLHLAGLLYDDNGWPQFLPGTIPLFWSDMPEEVLRRFHFEEWVPLVLFNPAHLFSELEKRGFRIESAGPHPLDVQAVRTKGDYECVTTGVHYYMRLIASCLMSSGDVLDLIDSFSEQSFEYVKQPGRYEFKLDLQLRGGRPPSPDDGAPVT